MRKYPGIPEMLETYMAEHGAKERWVTVHELRDRFGLTRYQCNAVSGFLRRLRYGPFGSFPFIVVRITPEEGLSASGRITSRYLLRARQGKKRAIPSCCSDRDAVILPGPSP